MQRCFLVIINTIKKKKEKKEGQSEKETPSVSSRRVEFLHDALCGSSEPGSVQMDKHTHVHTHSPQSECAQLPVPSFAWWLPNGSVHLLMCPGRWQRSRAGDTHSGSGSQTMRASLAATWFIKRALWLWELTSFWIANGRGGNCTLWKDWLNPN